MPDDKHISGYEGMWQEQLAISRAVMTNRPLWVMVLSGLLGIAAIVLMVIFLG